MTNCQKDAPLQTKEEAVRLDTYAGENEDVPHICIDQVSADAPGGIEPRGFAMKDKLWRNGQTIRVKFLNGSSFVRNKVQQYAIRWERYANINFDFVSSGDAEIRITFNTGGSWSKLGTDALHYEQDEATMNFGWFNENTSEASFRRTTIHEFGHALGIKHEHQNPTVGINWNKEQVYADMAEQGWSRSKTDYNIFRKYGTDNTEYCRHDPASLMNYSVPSSWTTDGFTIPWNSELSAGDKKFVSLLYPFPGGENLECADMEDAYIGLRHSSAYVARMAVTWTEYGTDGSRTGMINKRYDSGWRAVGYRHNIRMNRNARNIRVVAIAKTGNIFNPTKVIINEEGSVGRCYRVTGTVFGFGKSYSCD